MVPLICCTAEILKKSPKAKFSFSLFFFFKWHISACAKHQQSIQDLDDNKCNVNYMVIVTHF